MRNVLVIGTGGTISCAETENGLAPALSVEELIKGIGASSELPKGMKSPCKVMAMQFFTLDSTNITPRHWETLARYICERYDEFDGFVITHGTDTMGYAAASLSCLIQNPRKPIVLTGSMKPMTAENSDAPANLFNALRFAADERAFGVRVVFGGTVIDGRRAVKLRSHGELAFDVNACGFFTENGLIFDEEYRGETRFYERLSDDVFHVKLIPGQGLCVPENARAVILESYGAGGVPDYLWEDVERLAKRGVYVMIATQCVYGGTALDEYEVGRSAARALPLLETGMMTVEYAVARARWALEYSSDFDGFKKLFYGEDRL